jgi:hypothetical protein
VSKFPPKRFTGEASGRNNTQNDVNCVVLICKY